MLRSIYDPGPLEPQGACPITDGTGTLHATWYPVHAIIYSTDIGTGTGLPGTASTGLTIVVEYRAVRVPPKTQIRIIM